MQAHAEDGDTAGALRIYKALWELLDEDYGMEPAGDARSRRQDQARGFRAAGARLALAE